MADTVTELLGPPPDVPSRPTAAPPDPVAEAARMRLSADPLGRVQPPASEMTTYSDVFRHEHQRPGIPLDMMSGLPTWDRFQLGRRRTEDDQRLYLTKKYGDDSVFRSKDGQWIVSMFDPARGGTVDILADPTGIERGDVAGFAAGAGQVAAAIGATVLMRRAPGGAVRGIAGGARDIVAGATGSAVAGGVQDFAVRASEGAAIEPGEILSSRAALGVMDVGLSSVLGLGVGTASFLRNPYIRHRTDIQINAIAAQREFAERGVFVPLTPSELTGSRMLTAKESFVEAVPGGSTVFKEFRAKQASAMRLLQEVMFGTRPADADIVGRQAVTALRDWMAPDERAAESARRGLSSTALQHIERDMASRSIVESQLERTFVGDALRNRVTVLRDEAMDTADALYGRVRELGGDQPIFAGDGLADAATGLRAKLPPRFVNDPGAVAGLARTTEGQPVSAAFVPGDIRTMLDELIAGKGQQWRLSDLQQMRRRVYDDISKGEAVPGVDTHYLSEIGKSLTGAIDDGVARLPTSDLKDALVAANTHYKEKVVPFNRKGVAEMFAREGEPGYVGSATLAERYLSGAGATDRWRTLRDFLGAESIEMRLLRRQVFDNTIGGDSLHPGTGFLNARGFIKRLDDLETSNPDMFKDVFGPAGAKMKEAAAFVMAGEKDALPADQVAALLRSGDTGMRQKLGALLSAERKLNDTYRNSILDGIRLDKLDETKLKPEEFVHRFTTSANKEEVRQVMDILSPHTELVEDIRSAALQKAFREYGTKGKSISDALIGAERDKSLHVLLGEDLFTDLRRYGALEKAMIDRLQRNEMAGGFARGTRIDRIFTRPLRFVSDAFRENVTARVLTSDTMRKWVMSNPQTPESLMYMVVGSPPFLRSVLSSFGDDAEGIRQAESYIGSIKRGFDERTGSRNPPPAATTNSVESLLGPPPR